MPIPFDIIARYPLAPLLLWQGLKLRRTALILPEADGPRAGRIGEGPQKRLLITGDSSAAGVGVQHQRDALAGQVTQHLAGGFTLDWRLIAKTGATTKTTLHDLSNTMPAPYDTALVALGVNDVTRGTTVKQFLHHQTKLCEVLRQRFGAQHIILTAVPPLGKFPALSPSLQWILGAQAERFDLALQSWALTQPDCSYLSLDIPAEPDMVARDGFHPSAATYSLWAKAAAKLITDRWGD